MDFYQEAPTWEEPEEEDEPMNDPYTRPSRHSTARGSSQQREEPPRGSFNRERNLEKDGRRIIDHHQEAQVRESIFHQRKLDLDAEEEQEPYFEVENDVQEEAAALWVTEDQLEGDYLSDQLTSSVSASNPWVLYEAGVICSRLPDGTVDLNPNGDRIINLREWAYLLTNQRVVGSSSTPRYSTTWMGETSLDRNTFVIFFTRASEIGSWKSQHQRAGAFSEMRNCSERARANGSHWMRGQVDPQNWESRFEIDKNSWHETWLNYERVLEIQDDMDWLSEAVYQFYQVHLDRMIRKHDKFGGDFCRKRIWNDDTQKYDEFLEPSTKG